MCSTVAVKPVADDEEVLERRWRTLCNAFAQKVCRDLKPINATEAMELEQKLGSLTLKTRGSVTSPGDTELPIGEFRQLHSHVSAWLASTEAKLKAVMPSAGSESDEAAKVEAELPGVKQKLASLNETFNDVSFASEPDLEREVKSGTKDLNQRLEQVAATLDRYRVLRQSSLSSGMTSSEAKTTEAKKEEEKEDNTADDESEEIDTLPEEENNEAKSDSKPDSADSNKCAVIKSCLKNKSVDDSSKKVANSESNMPRATFESPKSPKMSYPSPKWYVNSKEISKSPSLLNHAGPFKNAVTTAELTSPERVRVVVNMLPSPQKTRVSPVTVSAAEAAVAAPQQTAQTETLPDTPNDDTPGSTRQSDLSPGQNFAVIDKILSETDASLAEMTSKEDDGTEYIGAVQTLLHKIQVACDKLDEVRTEQDLDLRVDLIEMDLKLLEAEADTLASRGQHLELMAKSGQAQHQASVSDVTSKLKSEWCQYKTAAESARNSVVTASVMLQQYDRTNEALKASMASSVTSTPLTTEQRREVTKLESFARSLRANHAFKSREIKHADLMDKCQLRNTSGQQHPDLHKQQQQQQLTPQANRKKVLSPQELAKRVGKLRTAVAALNRQLDSQLLHSSEQSSLQKQYESLNLQQKALETVQAALDKLRPMVKTTEKDFEFLGSSSGGGGSMSIEAVENVTGKKTLL